MVIQGNFRASFWNTWQLVPAIDLGGPDRGTKDSYQRGESVIGETPGRLVSHTCRAHARELRAYTRYNDLCEMNTAERRYAGTMTQQFQHKQYIIRIGADIAACEQTSFRHRSTRSRTNTSPSDFLRR